MIEQTYVLEGSLSAAKARQGRRIRLAPAGSRHRPGAGPQGGLMLAMFQIPNKFHQPDGRETDFLGRIGRKPGREAAVNPASALRRSA